MSIDFSNQYQLASLRSVFRRELQGLGAELTRSESASLNDQLDTMLWASNSLTAEQAFNSFQAMLTPLRSNSFRTEALTQKSDGPAAPGTEQSLQADLADLRARVDYLSRFGQSNGGAFLTPPQTTLLNGYLDRAEARLNFYAATQGAAPAALTSNEAADIRRALDGIFEPGDPAGGAAALFTQVIAQALE
jgi:hypothetical protein